VIAPSDGGRTSTCVLMAVHRRAEWPQAVSDPAVGPRHADIMEEHLDGTMRLIHQGQSLPYHVIMSRPIQVAATAHPAAGFCQTPAGASVASPRLPRASPRRVGVETVNQDISTLGEGGHF
jgi:hypothetical protein